MPRPCIVCSHPDRRSIDALIATGASDYEVGRQFCIERVSVGRHRRRHIIKPTQDRLAILRKDADAREGRRALAEAAASDEPPIDQLVQAATGTRALLRKLNEIERRLDRMSDKAEQGGQPTAVATLAGQQFKGLEFAAKLGGHPGFRPQSALPQQSDRPVVNIEFVFQGSGRTETIGLTGRPVINGDLTDPNSETPVPPPPPKQKFQGSIRDYWDFSERQLAEREDDPEKD
jgi:hypothetical protein